MTETNDIMTNQHPTDPEKVIDSFNDLYNTTCGICELIETADNPHDDVRAPRGSIAATTIQVRRNLESMQECIYDMQKIIDAKSGNQEVA